jgi:glycosyltransferase involved in cell wall biosynthesis
MPDLHCNNIELRIVGRDPAIRIIEAAKSDARIVVTGTVRDIIEEYQAADIFIAPMISGSGMKIKILEAMSCGLPIVATPQCVNAFPEIPEGVLVGDTADQIVSIIKRLVSDEADRKQLGCKSRMFIEKNWSWEQRTEKLVTMCRDVLVLKCR